MKKKILLLFTDGSFLELKKALSFNEKEIEEVKGDYDKIKIDSIIPIINQRRYCKNIVFFKKIIEFLNKSGISYILFYVGEEVNNRVENLLLNHIKNSKNKIYDSLMLKIKEKENKLITNINQSFIIRNINQNLKKINKDEIFDIIKNIISTIPEAKINKYHEFLYENLIENTNNSNNKYNILVFVICDYISKGHQNLIDHFNSLNPLVHIQLIYANKNNLFKQYEAFKTKKILKKYIFSNDKEILNDKILNYSLDFDVRNLKDIGIIN